MPDRWTNVLPTWVITEAHITRAVEWDELPEPETTTSPGHSPVASAVFAVALGLNVIALTALGLLWAVTQ